MKKSTTDSIVLIIAVILSIIFGGWFYFWISYFCGHFIEIFLGKYVVEGLAIFNIHIVAEQIPLIAGCLGLFSYLVFPRNRTNSNKN